MRYLLFLIAAKSIKPVGSLVLLLSAISSLATPAQAEGSRTLYPTNTGFRANLEWQSSKRYGPGTNSLLRRTLLQVYANRDEYILLGSSAVGINSGDIILYTSASGQIGSESLSGEVFRCSAQQTSTGNNTQGQIRSRTQELAGPDTISNATNATAGGIVPNGFVPCFYRAPANGIYYVVFFGPDGGNSDADGSPTGEINLASPANFNGTQRTSVAAWDVTVRSSLTSTTDITGRLFTNYAALFTGGNGRPVESTIYAVTRDGFRYSINLNGLDPNGFVLYGNNVGYYDSDGISPLYRNVLGSNGQLSSLQGGTSFALPTHLLFFSNPITTDVSNILNAKGIPTVPTLPTISNPSFTGTIAANTSLQSTGGTFSFTSNVPGSYEIVISRNGSDFDPANSQNRVLRGLITTAGNQSVNWDGKDNAGTFFPTGTNYPVRLTTRNGEYHFPLIDAENSTKGGPSFRLLNATNPLGNTVGFYDDRGYTTLSGVNVGTPGQVLCGSNPPSIPVSLLGFDTTSTQRSFGSNPGSNTNSSCTGSFGDTKGLDIWTYVPSQSVSTFVNILPNAPDMTVTKTHPGNFTRGGTGTYTIVAKNSGGIATSGTVTVQDILPTGLTPASAVGIGWNCTISGQTVTCTRSDGLAANSSYPPITLTVNVAANASASVVNTATVTGGGETITDNNSSDDPTTINSATPSLRLVKRITALNSTTYTEIIDDPGDPNDDSSRNWTTNYLTGRTGKSITADDTVPVKPGDNLEYTIYFLSDGNSAAQDVTLCDLIPANTTFLPNIFNTSTPKDSGASIGDFGLRLTIDNTTVYLSNADDTPDRGRYYAPGTSAPCGNNGTPVIAPNGAITVRLNSVPNATTRGTPNSFGFIRFRAKVN